MSGGWWRWRRTSDRSRAGAAGKRHGRFRLRLCRSGPGSGAVFRRCLPGRVFVWVQFLVRWRDERRNLGLSATGLAALIDELERPEGALHGALADRFRGRACTVFADRAAFEDWFADRASGRQTGALFASYLWAALDTPRTRLRPDDNRVGLTGVRNRLKRYRYHRWLNLGLANLSVSLGILGTVTGLWAGFEGIDFASGDVAGTMEGVMDALSRALYTTAVGVLLSMPILISGLKMERQLEELFGMVCEVQDALLATLRQFEGADKRGACR